MDATKDCPQDERTLKLGRHAPGLAVGRLCSGRTFIVLVVCFEVASSEQRVSENSPFASTGHYAYDREIAGLQSCSHLSAPSANVGAVSVQAQARRGAVY